MIQIENLTKRFGPVTAVDHLDFSVSRGEILGFLGPNGAGKSTTFKILAGYLNPSEGTCRLGGYDIVVDPLKAKGLIGYLQESPVLYREMNVTAYLRFVATVKKMNAADQRRAIDEVIETCGLQQVVRKTIGAVSKGYRQRVALAQALLGSPPILLLDEPTSALDPVQVVEIRNLIRSLAKRSTILLSTHILSEAMACCTRIMILSKGRLVTRDALADYGSLKKTSTRIRLRFSKAPPSLEECLKNPDRLERVSDQEVLITSPDPSEFRGRFLKACASRDWPLLEMRETGSELEDIFLKLTQSGGGS